jgi:hypothetical protein
MNPVLKKSIHEWQIMMRALKLSLTFRSSCQYCRAVLKRPSGRFELTVDLDAGRGFRCICASCGSHTPSMAG